MDQKQQKEFDRLVSAVRAARRAYDDVSGQAERDAECYRNAQARTPAMRERAVSSWERAESAFIALTDAMCDLEGWATAYAGIPVGWEDDEGSRRSSESPEVDCSGVATRYPSIDGPKTCPNLPTGYGDGPRSDMHLPGFGAQYLVPKFAASLLYGQGEADLSQASDVHEYSVNGVALCVYGDRVDVKADSGGVFSVEAGSDIQVGQAVAVEGGKAYPVTMRPDSRAGDQHNWHSLPGFPMHERCARCDTIRHIGSESIGMCHLHSGEFDLKRGPLGCFVCKCGATAREGKGWQV